MQDVLNTESQVESQDKPAELAANDMEGTVSGSSAADAPVATPELEQVDLQVSYISRLADTANSSSRILTAKEPGTTIISDELAKVRTFPLSADLCLLLLDSYVTDNRQRHQQL